MLAIDAFRGFVMFLILWRFRNHKHAEGWLFGVYCVMAGIERFIIEQERLHPEATGELSGILYDLALAAKMIANKVRSAGLADILGATDLEALPDDAGGWQRWMLDLAARLVARHLTLGHSVQALIATLATMQIVRSLAFDVTNGNAIGGPLVGVGRYAARGGPHRRSRDHSRPRGPGHLVGEDQRRVRPAGP